jgi:hypothetical protein
MLRAVREHPCSPWLRAEKPGKMPANRRLKLQLVY